MISGSCSHRVKVHSLMRVAERTAPIMGIDRSRFSSRTLLFLIVFFGIPRAARSDALEDSARELGRKIDAVVAAPGELSCDIRNVSTLDLDDVVRIERTLKTELQGRCARTQANGSEAANVVVTLSENVTNLVWTAEIHQGAVDREILQAVPRSAAAPKSTESLPIVLASERFWEGPERLLDAEFAASDTGDRLLVLILPDAVSIRNVSNDLENRIDLSLGISASTLREPSGTLSRQDGNFIDVKRERRNCTVSLSTFTVVKCWDVRGDAPLSGVPPLNAGQVVPVSTTCTAGKGISLFVTGTGDDTQPDYIQIVVSRDSGSAVSSNRIDFPGPVVAIHGGIAGESATVISRNLRTGNYEAYRLSISCRQ